MGRHRWKSSCIRNPYAVLWAPKLDQWVRVIYFGPDDYVMVGLDNRVLM